MKHVATLSNVISAIQTNTLVEYQQRLKISSRFFWSLNQGMSYRHHHVSLVIIYCIIIISLIIIIIISVSSV